MSVVEAVVDAEVVRSADEWADVIKADLSSAAEGIIAAGQHLIAAKADVRHGQWLPMLKQIGISDRSAQELMSIGRNPAINPRNCADLPTAARALYVLSRLPAEEIEEHVAAGTITPGMTISQTKALVNPPAGPEPAVAQCIHCGDTLPLAQLYEGGQGYECDPCVQGEDQPVPESTALAVARQGDDDARFESTELFDGSVEHTVDDRDFAAMTPDEYAHALMDEDIASTIRCRDCAGAGCEACFPADLDTGEVIEEKPIAQAEPATPQREDDAPEPVAQEPKRRRRPLIDVARDLTGDAEKLAGRIERFRADDRLGRNKNEVAARLRHHLGHLIQVCQDLNQQLT